MSEAKLLPSDGSQTHGGIKPRVLYSDLLTARWSAAFEKIQQDSMVSLNGEQFTVYWKYENPDWLQLKNRKRKLMVRRGDAVIFDLTSSR